MVSIKKKKIIIILIGVFVLLSAHIMRVVDLRKVECFQKPVFCLEINNLEEEHTGKYIGLGYSFDVKRIARGSVTEYSKLPVFTDYSMKIMGIKIAEAHAETSIKTIIGNVFKIEETEDPLFYYLYVSDSGNTRKILVNPKTQIGSSIAQDTETKIQLKDRIEVIAEYYPAALQGDVSGYIFPAFSIFARANSEQGAQ